MFKTTLVLYAEAACPIFCSRVSRGIKKRSSAHLCPLLCFAQLGLSSDNRCTSADCQLKYAWISLSPGDVLEFAGRRQAIDLDRCSFRCACAEERCDIKYRESFIGRLFVGVCDSNPRRRFDARCDDCVGCHCALRFVARRKYILRE